MSEIVGIIPAAPKESQELMEQICSKGHKKEQQKSCRNIMASLRPHENPSCDELIRRTDQGSRVVIFHLIGGLEHDCYFPIYWVNFIIPIDELIFFRGAETQLSID